MNDERTKKVTDLIGKEVIYHSSNFESLNRMLTVLSDSHYKDLTATPRAP